MDERPTVLSSGRVNERRRTQKVERTILLLAVYALLALISLVFVYPFYYMIIASFMTVPEILTLYPHLLPESWQLASYQLLFHEYPYLREIFNTVFIAVASTTGIVLFSSMAGFAFAKSRFPGRNPLFGFLLLTMMMPNQLQLIPMYEIMNFLHWRNTYYGVVVPGLVGAFGIFLMRQIIISSLPDEIIDAATIDGSSFAGTYWRICLPIVRPGLTVLALLAFVESWNSFLWPLLMLDKPELQTISVALASLEVGATMDPIFMTATIAGAVIGTIPLVVLLLLAQRSLIEGIASGAVKGIG